MAIKDPKQPRPAPKAAPVDESRFIGHDAPTMVDVSMAQLKEAHDAKLKARAKAGGPPTDATNQLPSLESRTVQPRAAHQAQEPEEEASTGETEAAQQDEEAPGEDEGGGEKLTVADLEAMTKVKLPPRLKAFFEK